MKETAAANASDAGTAGGGGGAGDRDGGDAIVARDVWKRYGAVVALDGVDLTVESGEVFGLIGPNGAGKTTLVRALTGTTEVEGEVRVFGDSPRAVDAQRVGLLPQSFGPPERLTARELVDYYGGLYDEARDTDRVLADVGLADDADVWYESLSGGQQRRACVATALVNDPDLLFLDEPTTGIDPAGRRSLHRLIEELAAAGTTVFLTSHAMDEVERLADRVGLMRDGEIVAVGDPHDLIAAHGGRPRLEVDLGEPAGEGVLATIRPYTSFDVERTGDGLRFVGVAPEQIADAVEALESPGVAFESLTWTEPSLEDVYLRLTGEEYSPRGSEGDVRGGLREDGGREHGGTLADRDDDSSAEGDR